MDEIESLQVPYTSILEKNLIIYLGGFILPDKNAAAHRVLSNSKIFRYLGYDVTLIGVSKESPSSDIFESRKQYQGFKCYEVAYPKRKKDWLRYLSSIKDFISVAESVNVNKVHSIILYNYPSVSFYRLIRFCRKNQIKVIADSTEWYAPEKGPLLYKVIKRIDSFFRMRYLHKKCDGIICISRYLNDFYSAKNKTIFLPPLVDLSEPKWSNNMISLSNIFEFTYVGSPGSSGEKESFDSILNALLHLSKYYRFLLRIVGVSKEELVNNSNHLESILHQLKDYVYFTGVIANSECIRLINKSHFFIFFRRDSIITRAGFPTKYVESISAGTPVLTNKTSNLTDFIIEGKTGFYINSESTTRQLEYCLQMPREKVIDMKQYCLESREFHFLNYLDKMSSFLETL